LYPQLELQPVATQHRPPGSDPGDLDPRTRLFSGDGQRQRANRVGIAFPGKAAVQPGCLGFHSEPPLRVPKCYVECRQELGRFNPQKTTRSSASSDSLREVPGVTAQMLTWGRLGPQNYQHSGGTLY
jgi:hypothetical protein